jgi:Domain of unknown function (DUF4383)
VLVIVGIVGFLYNASFAIGSDAPRDALLGLFDINGWHNVVHLVSGVVGVAASRSPAAARAYAFGFGAVYVLVTIIGFASGDGSTIFGLIPINNADNFLHLGIAAAGLAAGAASPAQPAPRRAT